jgi:DNA-binding beta-propeller fold protein YncE/plastocyanin
MNDSRSSTWRRFAIFAGVVALTAAVVACSGGSKTTSTPGVPDSQVKAPSDGTGAGTGGVKASANGLFPDPAPPPDPKSIPNTFKPEPGGLYFYTNTSIAYNSTNNFPWVIVVDAKTHKIVAGAEITDVLTSPHGIGVSPDGTQVYLPAGSVPAAVSVAADGSKIAAGVAVVDALTLKLTQKIGTNDRPHHIQVLSDKLMMLDAWGTEQNIMVFDPNDKNKIVKIVGAKDFGGTPYIAFPSPDGKYIYTTVRPKAGSDSSESWLSRIDVNTWAIEKVVDLGGEGAVWTAFGRDGKYAYVTVPGEDHVVKVDLLATPPKIVGTAATGRGPYGVNISPDEKVLLVVSKGEGGRGQRGGSFVTIDAETMRVLEEVPACMAFVCQPDHAVISPDGTEFWIDNNMGYLDVFDMTTLALKAELTMPNLGDPHGGVFVQYDKDLKGHVVMDTGGPRGGVSPYPFDNANGIPTLADALKTGWAPAKAYSALQLGAKPGSGQVAAATGTPTVLNVVMQDFFYEPLPAGTSVPAGSLVTLKMTNKGQAVHNLTSDGTTRIAAGLRLDIKQQEVGVGKSLDWTFKTPTRAGTYRVTCTYHPGMDLDLVVK